MKTPPSRVKTAILLPCAFLAMLLTANLPLPVHAQAQVAAPLAARVAQQALTRFPDGHLHPGQPLTWDHQLGQLLDGVNAVWENTADPRYFHFLKNSIDALVDINGVITARGFVQRPLDQEFLGRQLLLLYGVTQEKRYYLSARSIRVERTA